jgi:hypothetical protein
MLPANLIIYCYMYLLRLYHAEVRGIEDQGATRDNEWHPYTIGMKHTILPIFIPQFQWCMGAIHYPAGPLLVYGCHSLSRAIHYPAARHPIYTSSK